MKRLTIREHIDELRRRIVVLVLVFILLTLAAYFVAERLVDFLLTPIGEAVFVAPAELFLVQLRVALLLAVMIEIPLFLYHIWAFVADALPKTTRKHTLLFAIAGSLLFYLGVVFAYLVIIPLTIRFFLSLETETVTALISVGAYLSYLSSLLFGFGIVFLTPLAVLLATSTGLTTPKQLGKARPYVILLLFVIAAVLTPPDLFSQVLLAVPVYVLFELSLLIAWFTEKYKNGGKGV